MCLYPQIRTSCIVSNESHGLLANRQSADLIRRLVLGMSSENLGNADFEPGTTRGRSPTESDSITPEN